MFKKEKNFKNHLNKSDKEMRRGIKKENHKIIALTAAHAVSLVIAHTLGGAIVGDTIGYIIADSIEDAFPNSFSVGSSNYDKVFGLAKVGCTITGASVGLSVGFSELKCANSLCKESLKEYDNELVKKAMEKY